MTRVRPVTVRAAAPADAVALAALGARTFAATYADANPPGLVDAHVREQFGAAIQAAELADPAIHYLVAERDRELLGYAMLADAPPPDAVHATAPVQLSRLYVDASAQRLGIGTALVAEVLARAAELGHDLVWLTVWTRNPRAIVAYEGWGFVDVGATVFDMAGDHQVDRVMVRRPVV